jgi:anthranilate 1,2-dioxygenase large subunit
MNVSSSWPAADFSRVPFSIYHDPDVYRREQELIFRGPTWNYLALEAELPNPRDFLTTRLGDTSILVNRDSSGKIHAFVNRCMHRGAELQRETTNGATGWTANCAACPFHVG